MDRFITANDLQDEKFGLYTLLFQAYYPNGEYLSKLQQDAQTQHWLAYLLTLLGDA